MSGNGATERSGAEGEIPATTAGPQPVVHVEVDNALDERPGLVLDEFDEKLDAFNALRKSDVAAADRILDQVGATDSVDRQIILELASKRPLGHPERFPEAHAGAMRALEVLDRNASGGVRVSGVGPLAPLAQYAVQQVVHFLVKSHLRNVVNNLSHLYGRREAAALKDDPLLKGAAIARRRIKLTTDQPLDALYQTVGRCGRPPQDQARLFALVALILMALAWVAVPVGLGVSIVAN